MKKILVLSDLHVGSQVGLFLHEFNDVETGLTHVCNDVQAHLFAKWCDMVNKVGEVDYVFCNGDIIDGKNPAENGRGCVMTDMHTQAEIAVILLNMIRAKEYYFTDGSPFHTGSFKGGQSGDRTVCDLIGGHWLGLWEMLTVDNVKIHIRHSDNYSSNPAGRTTGQRRESLIKRSQGTDIDLNIRSHTHHFNFSGDAKDTTIGTPCFQGITEFIGKRSQEMPDNGWVILNIEDSNFTFDYEIFTIPYKMYNKGLLKL